MFEFSIFRFCGTNASVRYIFSVLFEFHFFVSVRFCVTNALQIFVSVRFCVTNALQFFCLCYKYLLDVIQIFFFRFSTAVFFRLCCIQIF